MRINLTMRAKMLIVMLLIYFAIFAFISARIIRSALEDGEKMADSFAMGYANYTLSKLNEYNDAVRTVGQIFESYKKIPENNRRQIFQNIMKDILAKNEDFLSVWSIWEPGTIDNLDALYVNTQGSTQLGNFSPTYYKENGFIKLEIDILDTTIIPLFSSDYFTIPKANKTETILEPYFYSFTGNKNDEVLMTSLVYPIMENGIFLGVIGIDVGLDVFCETIPNIDFLDDSKAFLLSNGGVYVAHHDRNNLGESIATDYDSDNKIYDLLDIITSGEQFSYTSNTNGNENSTYLSFYPIRVGKTDTPWSILITVPTRVIISKTLNDYSASIIIGILGFILLSVAISIIAKNISRTLMSTANTLEDLARGDIDDSKKIVTKSKDAIGKISDSVNKLIDGLKKKTNFAREIGTGNLDENFELQSEKDILGSSLIEMRENLKAAKMHEEERKLEDERRNWVNQGIAKFSEILRQNNDNMELLTYELISNLVKYTNSNQGGLYLIKGEEEGDKHIELISCFAYDRSRFHKRRIEWGVGLIGACMLEKETIFITDVPNDYVRITSGLGDSNPTSVLIVPLNINDEIQGIIEFASFNIYEKFEIEFFEKIAENIASTISSVKINVRTVDLLEKSQEYAEEMSMKEEEMRQNIEELQATQEQAARREDELKKEIGKMKKKESK